MSKLPEISKRNIFEVPEGYFEKLPTQIQLRIAQKEHSPIFQWSWGVSLRFAIPVVIIAVACVFWFRNDRPARLDMQAELSRFKPEQLAEYVNHNDLLADNEISTEDLVDSVKWSKNDVDQLEKSVYAGYGNSQKEIQKILDELDPEL